MSKRARHGLIDYAHDPLAVLLHTAARRYCMEQSQYWQDRYSVMNRAHRVPYTYTSRDLATFPRYNVLEAILVEVERLDPARASLGELLELLVRAGRTAESPFTHPLADVSRQAMEEEREAFCTWIESLDEDTLWRVRSLPHRHVLSAAEAKKVHEDLVQAWDIEGYWYPLAAVRRSDLEAFDRTLFEGAGANAMIRSALESASVHRLWRWEEDGTVFEIEPESFDVRRTEAFFCSAALDWIVYVSRASTVAVGGWLLDALRSAWPEWHAAAITPSSQRWSPRRSR